MLGLSLVAVRPGWKLVLQGVEDTLNYDSSHRDGLERCFGERQYSGTDRILRIRQRGTCRMSKFLIGLTRVVDDAIKATKNAKE